VSHRCRQRPGRSSPRSVITGTSDQNHRNGKIAGGVWLLPAAGAGICWQLSYMSVEAKKADGVLAAFAGAPAQSSGLCRIFDSLTLQASQFQKEKQL
jgi:hypothetical protein